MRISIFLAVGLSLLGGYCGYRIVQLEQRIDALNKRLGAPPVAAKASAEGPTPIAGHEQRLTALEEEVRTLRDDLRTLEEATGERPQAADLNHPTGSPQQILAVVTREQNRIRDRQIDFHRARWMEWRESALTGFAKEHRLSVAQTEQIHQLLTDETDKLVELLRRPDALENPEQSAIDWAAVLDDTDRVTLRVLDPAQRTPWTLGRAVERHMFWPWLPKPDSE